MHIDKSLIDNQIDLRPENTLAITLQSGIYDGHLPIHNAHVIMNTLISSGLSGVDIIQCTPTDHLMPNETVDILKQNGIYVKLTPVFDVFGTGYPSTTLAASSPHAFIRICSARTTGQRMRAGELRLRYRKTSSVATMLDTWPLIGQETRLHHESIGSFLWLWRIARQSSLNELAQRKRSIMSRMELT